MRRASLSAPPRFTVDGRLPSRVELVSDTGARAYIFVLEEDIVRLLVLPDGMLKGPPSWAVAPGAADVAEPGRDRLSTAGFACPEYTLVEQDGVLTIATSRIRLSIGLEGLRCSWCQRWAGDWRLMAADRPTQSYEFGWWDGRVYHYMSRRPGERYYGLGERAGAMDRASRRLRLTNLDPMGYDAESTDPLYKSVPYLLIADADGACHGAFYDIMSDVTFDLGCEVDNYHGPYRYIVAESGDLDLYMIAGPDPLQVTRRFTWLTGRPALMPRWSLGYSGSTMTYTDAPDAQARMAEFIEKLHEHAIACSSFHLSSGYTSIGAKRYVFNWNRDKFPDPAAFVASYRAAGIELVPNIKPVLLRDHPQYGEVAAKGLFISDWQRQPVEAQFWDDIGSFVDFTNPKAATWWKEQVRSVLLSYGIRATWNDNNECGLWDSRARFHFFGTPRHAREARPLQSLLMSRASRAAQLEHNPDLRPYLVSRSGMAGLQRYAQTWSGDNRTAWKTIRYNSKMGLGLALSGQSNSGHDVGGFAGPAPDPELFVRWVQAGIFMPRFSIHSWNDDGTVNEPWMYPECLPVITQLMALRQKLIPYLYELVWRYHREYEPMIRPLWLDFPGDPEAWVDGDEYLLGPDLLVPLVCEPGLTTRRVRVPVGVEWIDVWTGARYAGGATVELAASLDGPPPLLARVGSVIPVDLPPDDRPNSLSRRGLWLFPPSGTGECGAQFHEDQGEGHAPCDRLTVHCRTTDKVIEVEVSLHRDGREAPFSNSIEIVLPPGESRSLQYRTANLTPT